MSAYMWFEGMEPRVTFGPLPGRRSLEQRQIYKQTVVRPTRLSKWRTLRTSYRGRNVGSSHGYLSPKESKGPYRS